MLKIQQVKWAGFKSNIPNYLDFLKDVMQAKHNEPLFETNRWDLLGPNVRLNIIGTIGWTHDMIQDRFVARE